MSRVGCPVRRHATQRPSATALRVLDQTWTWHQLDERVTAWAAWFAQRGVGPATRVAVVSWNRPELIFALHALARLGATLVPINARLTEAEALPLLERSGATLRLGDEAARARLPTLEPLPVPAASEAPLAATVDSKDLLVALYTSGTTGSPKLIELSRANFEANAAASAENVGADPSHRWLCVMPLFHVGGLAMAMRCALSGCTLLLEPSFDAARVAAMLADGVVTHTSFVATALERVVERLGSARAVGLQAVLIGGGPVTLEQLSAARRADIPALQTYGLTEACSQVTTERLADADGSTAGVPIQGVELRVVDAEGRALPTGAVGLVVVRGPTVAPGCGPELMTNDLGSLDERGRLRIACRRSDLILSGGENVYPAEVEQVLALHPNVREVVVVARPDATWGQVPVALVHTRGPLLEQELLDFAAARLARFTLPRAFVEVSEIPRNSMGKVDRQAVAVLARNAWQASA